MCPVVDISVVAQRQFLVVQQTIDILQLQYTDNVVDVSCAAARRAGLSISPARLRSAPHLAV